MESKQTVNTRDNLPRLLCLSDVPPSESVSGPMLVYRLLQAYPPERLRVISSSIAWVGPRRLPGVSYEHLNIGPKRLLRTRFWYIYQLFLLLSAPMHARRLDRLVRRAGSDAIVTVVDGFAWLIAAELARRHQLPLHLMFHDDWLKGMAWHAPFDAVANIVFERTIQQAASCLCVSPYMTEEYCRRYNITTHLLLPLRDKDANPPRKPVLQSDPARPFTCAYAGSLFTPAYSDMVEALKRALEPIGGRLLVFTPQVANHAQRWPSDDPTVQLHSAVPAQELVVRLREEVDLLFVPMAFHEHIRHNMMMGFPSKLADYTSVGLPLLIWGPPECSAVRWAREYPGVAAVLDEDDPQQLAYLLRELADNPEQRYRLAQEALRVGAQLFDHEVVTEQFYDALMQSKLKQYR